MKKRQGTVLVELNRWGVEFKFISIIDIEATGSGLVELLFSHCGDGVAKLYGYSIIILYATL